MVGGDLLVLSMKADVEVTGQPADLFANQVLTKSFRLNSETVTSLSFG